MCFGSALWHFPLWSDGLTQIQTYKQIHQIRSAGITDSTALPPPLPDVLSSQARVKLCVLGGIVTITQPQAGTDASPCGLATAVIRAAGHAHGRLIPLVPPGTHFVFLIHVPAEIGRRPSILLPNNGWLIATCDDSGNILPTWTASGIAEAYIGLVTHIPCNRP